MGLVDPRGEPIASTLLTDEQTIQLMVAEMRACRDPLILGPLEPLEAYGLAAIVQLASRHPDLSETHRAIAAAVIETVREYFIGSPTILDTLTRGDDPRYDIAPFGG